MEILHFNKLEFKRQSPSNKQSLITICQPFLLGITFSLVGLRIGPVLSSVLALAASGGTWQGAILTLVE